MITLKYLHLKLICFHYHLFSYREEQKTILPVTSCFNQPLPVSISSAGCLPITTSVSVGNLILKTHVMSEDKNDFLKPIANGKMVNSWKEAHLSNLWPHLGSIYTSFLYIYNIYYIMYIFFKKRILLGASISCGLFDTSSPLALALWKKKENLLY